MTQSRFIKEGASVLGISMPKPKEPYRPRISLYGDDEREISSSGSGYSSSYAKSMLNTQKPTANNQNANKYKSGTKVKHPKFGEGIVITVKGTGDNIIVDVAFKGIGIKSLSAKYAPMEII